MNRSYSDFSAGNQNELTLVPQVKAVVLAEYEGRSYYQYINSITSKAFFEDMDNADIRIVYNSGKLSDCSFSLATNVTDKYDFVSIVIRDLLKGIGYSSNFKADASTGEITNIANTYKTAFDGQICGALCSNGNTPYVNATSGALQIFQQQTVDATKQLSLYAPSQWTQGVSLNYFIPTDDYKLSKVMTYQFGKGTVTRDLTDENNKLLQYQLLGWYPYLLSSVSSDASSSRGSTEDFISYEGTISVGSQSENSRIESQSAPRQVTGSGEPIGTQEAIDFINKYCKPYHAFYHGDDETLDVTGWTVSFLKKDGSWDCAYFISSPESSLSISTSDLNLNCEASEYARTCEGYLRCRITRSYQALSAGSSDRRCYNSWFYVMDYTPQAVELGVNEIYEGASGESGLRSVLVGMK